MRRVLQVTDIPKTPKSLVRQDAWPKGRVFPFAGRGGHKAGLTELGLRCSLERQCRRWRSDTGMIFIFCSIEMPSVQ